MKNTHRLGWLSALFIVLFLSSLACNLPGRTDSESTDLPAIPVTTQAAEALQETVASAREAFNNNQPVEITLTEAQLTSTAALELEKDSEIPLSEPQIYLRDGQVSIFATATQSQLSLPVEVAFILSTDGQGSLQYEITKSQIGPLPIPDNIMSRLTSRLDQIIANMTVVDNSQMYIESITVGDGVVVLRGYKR